VAQKMEEGKSFALSNQLLAWYDRHRRVLPWRALPGGAPDPYKVWLSEIMLQQTTVATVGPYFQKFIKRWPTLHDLAKADLESIRQMWAGLGYYRRAQLLHECARLVLRNYKDSFPSSENELRKLPGFGPYTAAAVAAIAFDQRANVIDGNVERVMARLRAVKTPLPKAKAKLRALAEALLPNKRFGDYAQALMDLGATVCTPKSPKCSLCPWISVCEAKAKGLIEKLPRRVPAKAKPQRRAIAFVLYDAKKRRVLLRRRPAKGLLAGMMEVPTTVWSEKAFPKLETAQKEAPVRACWRLIPGVVRHVFSHFELELKVAIASSSYTKSGCWVLQDRLANQALPSVMHKVIRHAQKHEREA